MIQVVFEWQTLIGSSFAIFAALMGGRYVQKQIQHAENIDRAQNFRKFSAARANLPLALSAMSDYAYECAALLKDFYSNMQGKHLRQDYQVPSFPSPPAEAIANLTTVVECAEDVSVAEIVSDLLSEIQVANSRFRRLHERFERRGLFKSNFDEFVIDVADIYARINDMFDFARRESDSIPQSPELETILAALNLLQFREAQFEHIKATAVRRYARRHLLYDPKTAAAKKALRVWLGTDPETAMQTFEVMKDGEQFRFREFCYAELEDAILYSALQKFRSM